MGHDPSLERVAECADLIVEALNRVKAHAASAGSG
jgi:hypothetical protein